MKTPTPTIGQLMLSALAAQKGKDLDLAKALYEQVLEREPDNIDALHMLGVVHFSRGDLDVAEGHIRCALSLCQTPIANINHNLLMIKEARAGKSGPDPVSLRIVRESDLPRVAASCRCLHPEQELALPGLTLPEPPAAEPVLARFPAILAYELDEATIDPESEFPSTDDVAVLPDWLDLHRHEPSEFHYGTYRRSEPDQGVDRCHLPADPRYGKLAEGVVLTSSHWTNWAHFLTEQLPKAILAENHEPWRGMPFLINGMCLPNAEQLLRSLVSPERPIIKVCGRMRVGRATFISTVGYCPFEYRGATAEQPPAIAPTDALFSPHALDTVRTACRRLAVDGSTQKARRIYLKRSGKMRQLASADQIESTMIRHGFVIVAPETLPLGEQIGLFAAADVIVGQAGAGLANMIFADPGLRILAFAARTRHNNYHYFANMAQALGHRLEYLFGHPMGDAHHPAHTGLAIGIDELDHTLEQLVASPRPS